MVKRFLAGVLFGAVLATAAGVFAQSWTAPRTYVAGELITPSILNTHVRDNLTILRAGGIAMTSQAANQIVYATSATQLAASATLPNAVQDNITRTGTITSGVWNAGAVTSSGTIAGVAGNFSGLLTVSGVGTHSFSAGGTVNALSVRNTTSGANNYSGILLGNDAAAGTLELLAWATGTNNGPYQASGVSLDGAGAGGLSVMASNALGTIRFYTGGTTLRGTMSATGAFDWDGTVNVRSGGTVNFVIAPSVSTIGTTTNHDLNFKTNDTVVMVLANTGGLRIGSPTGGDKGAGTLNAVAVYDDNVQLTDWVFDLFYDGSSRDPIPSGGRLYSLSDTRISTQQLRRLPWMPTRASFESERSLGRMVTSLWFGQEQQQLYIQELEARIAALEQSR